MAIAGRRRRRRPRWLVMGVALTLTVLALNAALSSRDDEPSRRLAEVAYLDEVRPHIEGSSEQGADLVDVREQAAELGRDGIGRRLERVARQARVTQRAVTAIRPPVSLEEAHSLLVSTMVVRADAAAVMAEALVDALGTRPPDAAVGALAGVGRRLVTADSTYRFYLEALPRGQATREAVLPESVWAAEPDRWSGPELTAFVAGLRSSTALAPVHDVALVLVKTVPSAARTEGAMAVIPLTRTLDVEVVVANVGNEPEKQVTVLATLTAASGAVDTVRKFVDLAPRQRQALTLGGLVPVRNEPSTLTITVGPVDEEASPADNERMSAIVVR